jgi:hypothetical protein
MADRLRHQRHAPPAEAASRGVVESCAVEQQPARGNGIVGQDAEDGVGEEALAGTGGADHGQQLAA